MYGQEGEFEASGEAQPHLRGGGMPLLSSVQRVPAVVWVMVASVEGLPTTEWIK